MLPGREVWKLVRRATQRGLRKGRNVLRRVWLKGAQLAVGFSWGPDRREWRRSPSPSAPGAHTRTFLRRTAVELEAKDTFWRSEFHSLLAKSGFLPGEGVHACAHECTQLWGLAGRGPRVEATPVFPGTRRPVLQSSDKYLERMNRKRAGLCCL